MQNCIGIINSSSNSGEFKSLIKQRPDYMLPFGGRYRIIDFTLSNVANYNLSNVILFGGKNIRSTMDHIGDGKSWELNRRRNGLTINPPTYDQGMGSISEIKTYFDAMDFLMYSNEEYVYICDPMTITKANIKQAYDEFVEKNLDIMLLYKDMNDVDLKFINSGKLTISEDGTVTNIGMNLGTENRFNLYLNRMFVKKSVFIELIAEAIEKGNAATLIQAISNNLENYKVGSSKSDAFVDVIRDLQSFYSANMNLLRKDVFDEVFYKGGMILTKSKDEPSTLYKEGSKVVNSLVANGCIIEGHVENSIIFRGVHIGKNAIVKNSLLIQNTIVEEDSVVVNAIIDKFGHVEKGVSIVGAPGNPLVIEKGERVRKD